VKEDCKIYKLTEDDHDHEIDLEDMQKKSDSNRLSHPDTRVYCNCNSVVQNMNSATKMGSKSMASSAHKVAPVGPHVRAG